MGELTIERREWLLMVNTEKEPRFLVPVDGSECADLAVETAAELARAVNGRLDILHVSYFDSSTDSAEDEDSWLPDIVTSAAGKEHESSLEQAKLHVPEDVAAEYWQRTGVPADEILKLARELASSLIVVGGRGLGVMQGFLLGSVSQQLVEESPVSVLIVKDGSGQADKKEAGSLLPDVSSRLSYIIKALRTPQLPHK